MRNIVAIKGIQTDVSSGNFIGQLVKVKYKDRNGGDFRILQVGHVICLGCLTSPNIGAMYTLVGSYKQDKRPPHDWQFHFKSATFILDSSEGVSNYLSKECPDIGPSIASRIVARYKENVFKMLASEIDRVAVEVSGFPIKKKLIVQEWAKSELIYSGIKLRLYNLRMTPALILKLIASYGKDVEEAIRKDPFGIQEIKGLGFKTADAISVSVGLPRNDPERIKAGINYTINQSREYGHTCIIDTELVANAAIELSLDQASVKSVFDEMVSTGNLFTEMTDWEAYRKTTNHNY